MEKEPLKKAAPRAFGQGLEQVLGTDDVCEVESDGKSYRIVRLPQSVGPDQIQSVTAMVSTTIERVHKGKTIDEQELYQKMTELMGSQFSHFSAKVMRPKLSGNKLTDDQKKALFENFKGTLLIQLRRDGYDVDSAEFKKLLDSKDFSIVYMYTSKWR